MSPSTGSVLLQTLHSELITVSKVTEEGVKQRSSDDTRLQGLIQRPYVQFLFISVTDADPDLGKIPNVQYVQLMIIRAVTS